MSRIDVTELLSDPDFVDTLVQIKRISNVDLRGKNQIQEKEIKTIGSVQPASGKTINRLPEDFRVANISEFFMKGEITASKDGRYSDVLVFKGKRYNVQTVFDWTNWGAGYCQGTCIAENPT